jgi:DNA-binding IclR family transcriptional regulator
MPGTGRQIGIDEGENPGVDSRKTGRRKPTLALAVDLLELVAGWSEPVAEPELAAASGVSGARLRRVLNALIDIGLISPDTEETYALAARSVHLAGLILSTVPWSRVATPVLEKLAAETGETATFNAYLPREGNAMIHAVAEGNQSLRYALEPGEALALHAGAGGKAILAFLPSVEIARILGQPQLAALTRHTVTDRGELDRHLEIIRQEGYAVAREERLIGAVEIAAPVFDAPSHVVGSLGITAPEHRFTPHLFDHHGQAVRRFAADMSTLLGLADPSAVASRQASEGLR